LTQVARRRASAPVRRARRRLPAAAGTPEIAIGTGLDLAGRPGQSSRKRRFRSAYRRLGAHRAPTARRRHCR
jgi:hypothetical protein